MLADKLGRLADVLGGEDAALDLLASVLEGEHVAVALLTPDEYRYAYANDAYHAIAPEKEMIGHTYAELWPEAGEKYVPVFDDVMSTGETLVEKDEYVPVSRTPGGELEPAWFSHRLQPLDFRGRRFLLVVLTETTAEVRASEARRELETTRLLLDAAVATATRTDLQELLEALAQVLLRVTEHARVTISLWDEAAGELEIAASAGSRPLSPTRFPRDRLSAGLRHVIETGERGLTDYDQMPPDERGPADQYASHLTLQVPLRYRDRVVGVIGIDDPGERREFSEREIDLIEGMAAQVAVAIENARLFEAERGARRQARRELDTAGSLLRAADALAVWTDIEKVFEGLADVVLEVTDHARATIETWDDERKELRVVAGEGEHAYPVGAPIPWNSLNDSTRRALSERRTTVNDFDLLPDEERAPYEASGVHLVLQVPVVYRDRLLGLITLDQPGERREFSEREIEVVEGIAAQAAVAIENARLLEAQRESTTMFEVLAQVSLWLNTMPLREALPRVLERSAALLGASGSITASRVEGGWRTAYRFGAGANGLKPFYTDEESPVRLLMERTRESQVMPDVLKDPAIDPDIATKLGYRSYISMPLLLADRVVGALSFFFAEPDPAFSEAEQRFLERIRYVVASGLENERLNEERQRQVKYAIALNEISDAVHSTLEFNEIMKRVVVEIARALEVDAAAVHMHRGDHWEFTYESGLPQGMRSLVLPDAEAPLSMRILQTREQLVSNDILHDERANVRLMSRFDITALIGVPLVVRGDALGVLFVGCIGDTTSFEEMQVDFVRKAAATLGLALENARIFQAEHDIADRLQSALLSLPASLPGIEFAHAYHSAAEAARVGGDFYDLFELEHELIGITLGDVAGKGLDAAVLTSLVKNAIRAHASEKGPSPAAILSLTNDLVYQTTQGDSFVTVFFAVLDCRDGRMVYTNAGHPDGLVVRTGGSVEKLPPTGPVIGAFRLVAFEQNETVLDLNESLFLYTDGLTEARRAGELFGEERVYGLLTKLRDGDPPRAVQRVIDEVLRFTGGGLNDDLAILALRRVEGETEPPAEQKVGT